jgi:hypothetical protein
MNSTTGYANTNPSAYSPSPPYPSIVIYFLSSVVPATEPRPWVQTILIDDSLGDGDGGFPWDIVSMRWYEILDVTPVWGFELTVTLNPAYTFTGDESGF